MTKTKFRTIFSEPLEEKEYKEKITDQDDNVDRIGQMSLQAKMMNYEIAGIRLKEATARQYMYANQKEMKEQNRTENAKANNKFQDFDTAYRMMTQKSKEIEAKYNSDVQYVKQLEKKWRKEIETAKENKILYRAPIEKKRKKT